MTLFQTTCSLCRDWRDDLKCGAQAFGLFASIALVIVAVLALIAGVIYCCIDQEAIWPAPAILMLLLYWSVYKDMC